MEPSTAPETNEPTKATFQLLSVFTVLLLLVVSLLFHAVTITIAALAMGENVNSARVPYSFIRKTMREGATAIRLLINSRGVYRSTRTTDARSNHHGFGETDGHDVALEEITV